MDREQRAFFEDLETISDTLPEDYACAVAESPPDWAGPEEREAFTVLAEQLDATGREAFRTVVRQAVLTSLHSTMVIFAGGRDSAAVVSLEIVKGDGEPLVPHGGYHEAFMEHLFDTGRET